MGIGTASGWWRRGVCVLWGAAGVLASAAGETSSLPPGDWAGIRAAHDQWRHSFTARDDGFTAQNPRLGWGLAFDANGFVARPRSGGWEWGLAVTGYGFAGKVRAVGGGAEAGRAEGPRLARWRGGALHEWFVNDGRGLQQGFTVTERPEGAEAGGPLVVDLAVRGGLRAQVVEGGRDAVFVDGAGTTVVRYTGLMAWDADGRMLPARMVAPAPDRLTMEVNEAGARYPVTIDPIAVTDLLKAINPGEDTTDHFGTAVALSSNTLVVGAPGEDGSGAGANPLSNEACPDAGAAYVFVRSGTNWTQQAYLKALNPGSNDLFGSSVALSGDTVVVGAEQEDGSGTGVNAMSNEGSTNAGAAYVFVRTGTNWSAQAYLKPLNTASQVLFGKSVAVSSNHVLVGAPNWNAVRGAVYVFVRSGTNWSQQAQLAPANAGSADSFGWSVSLSDGTALVGAWGEDGGGSGVNPATNDLLSGSGAAYVFERSGTNWGQQAYLKASNPGLSDSFGWSVGVWSNTAVVGAWSEDGSGTGVNPASNNLATNAGAAYVFVRSGTNWSPQATLKASNTGEYDEFGRSLAVAGDVVVVGALGEDGSGVGVNPVSNESATGSGAAYVFARSGTNWSHQAYLKPWETKLGDAFGSAVAAWGDRVVCGAPDQDDGRAGINPPLWVVDQVATDSGAGYVFVRSGTNWTQDVYAKAPNVGNNAGHDDWFGAAVGIFEDTVVVGAPQEDGSGSGANPPDDNLLANAGAAYVYVRNGGVWSFQAYLKASNPGADDYFGRSVAIWRDRILVGAPFEDGGGAGVDPASDETLVSAGAAYVFVRNGSNWSQQAYLKAFNPGSIDQFGLSVSLSYDTAVIGAPYEDGSGTGVNPAPNEGVTNAGAAYVFVRDSSAWGTQAYLKSGNPGANDRFGWSVSVHSNRTVIGATGEDGGGNGVNPVVNEGATDAGAAYVFDRSGTNWTGPVYVKAGNSGADDEFGMSVSVWGDSFVVGAPYEDGDGGGVNPAYNNAGTNSGAAYLYTRSGTNWSQRAYLKGPTFPEPHEGRGFAVALWEGTVVMGTPYSSDVDGIITSPASGAVCVFTRTGTNWSYLTRLKGDPVVSTSLFGLSVAVFGDTFIGGAPYDDLNGAGVNPNVSGSLIDSGAAFLAGDLPVPEIAVRGNGNNIADGDDTPAPGNNTDFGSATVGVGAVVKMFSLTNSGTADLVLGTMTVTGAAAGDFNVSVPPPSPVATNSEVYFQVVFTPSSGGLRGARIRFDNNDPDENPFTFSIEGTGVGPEIGVSGAGSDVADGSLTPTTTNLTDFGGVLVNGSVQRTFIITNTGSTNLTVGTVSVGGANPAAFTVNTQPAASVAAGASTFFRVTFSPSVANVRNATLSFTNSDFNEASFDFAVRGVGAATALEVWRQNYFGTVSNTGVAANIADPDGDGLRNLMEFALGDNPTRVNADGVTVTNNGGVLSLYYPRATQSSNITLRAWWTTNLLVWATNGITETKLSDDGTNQTWRASVLRSGRPRLFLRLQSTDP